MLVNYLIYFHQLDNFAALHRMNHGDMKATIAQIISIARAHPEDPFYAVFQAANPETSTRDSSASLPPKK